MCIHMYWCGIYIGMIMMFTSVDIHIQTGSDDPSDYVMNIQT